MHKLRYVLAGILMLGLAFPAVTSANGDDDDDGKRCSQIGTWFGVVSPDDLTLTGVMWSTMGKSENYGINILEQPNGDPTLGGFCPAAVRSSPLLPMKQPFRLLLAHGIHARHELPKFVSSF